MRDWQPIETAPKDGTVIDLWARTGRIANAWWEPEPSQYPWSEEDRRPRWVAENLGHDGSDGTVMVEPTHWMPLPPSPHG